MSNHYIFNEDVLSALDKLGGGSVELNPLYCEFIKERINYYDE